METEPQLDVGVVVVTHNNQDTIQDCLHSLGNQGVSAIWVIDSASSDRTLENIEGAYDIVRLSKNKGFGYAANRGGFKLNTKYVLFINPDAQASPGSITSLVQQLEANPRAGVIGGLLVDMEGVPEQDCYGEEPTLWNMFKRNIQKKDGVQQGCIATNWVSGGALMIRSDLFRSVGGFDEHFFLYWEDIDLCRRVRGAGFGVYIDTKARIWHVRGGSGLSRSRKTLLYDQSANRYFHKYYSPLLCFVHQYLRKFYRLVRPSVR